MDWRSWDGEVSDPGLRQLRAYWEERRSGCFAPARRSIDPVDLACVLGDVALIEVERDPLRFRYRLHGTNLVKRTNVDMTGRSTEEVRDPEFRRLLREILTEVYASQRPWQARANRSWLKGPGDFEVLLLPLSEDGESVTMILSCWRCLGYEFEKKRPEPA